MRFVRLQSRGENEGVEVSMPDESNAYRWAVAVTPPTDVPLFGESSPFQSSPSPSPSPSSSPSSSPSP